MKQRLMSSVLRYALVIHLVLSQAAEAATSSTTSPLLTLLAETIHHQHRRKISLRHFRGGASTSMNKGEEEDEAENAMLDAYIEELLATVDNQETTQQFIAEIHRDVEPTMAMPENDHEVEQLTQQQQQQPKSVLAVSPSSKDSALCERRTRKMKKRRKKKDHMLKGHNATPPVYRLNYEEADVAADSIVSPISEGGEEADSTDPSTANNVGQVKEEEKLMSQSATTNKSVPSNQTRPSDSATAEQTAAASPTPTTPRSKAPTKGVIPNPLFRFLLHRGRIGQAIVMVMVLWFEWLAIYLPTLSRSLDWVYVHTVPRSIREPRRLRQGAAGGRRERPLPSATAASTLARTGTSRKRQRELTRQADQVAMQQLKALDSNSRFRHVSLSFLRRHRMGPYQNGANVVDEEVEQSKREDSGVGGDVALDVVPYDGKKSITKSGRKKKLDSVEEHDWVIQALTKDQERNRGGKSSSLSSKLRPTLSIQFGSGGGLSVGLELGTSTRTKYRQSVAAAVHATPPAPPRSKRSQVSRTTTTSDAAGGIMGKLRAAAGSSVSRSLLGAYPGDAVPVDEAADSHGLEYLAERYGYGQMIDESEEEEDGFGTRKPRKRRKKPKRAPPTEKGDGMSSFIASLQNQRKSSSLNKGIRTPMERINRARPREHQSPTRHPNKQTSPRSSLTAEGTRPMDRINSLKSASKSRSDEPKRTVPMAAASKLEELRTRRKSED